MLRRSPIEVLDAGQSGQAVRPDNVCSRMENFVWDPVVGGYTAASPPAEYHAAEWLSEDVDDTDYTGTVFGLHHAWIGQREVLLRHQGDNVYMHAPWEPDWIPVVGASATALLEDDTFASLSAGGRTFLTQFVTTPKGVVIIPQGTRAYFFDGEVVLPLGYDAVPSAPRPLGPRYGFTAGTYTSATYRDYYFGYAHNGLNMNKVMGLCRLGTVDAVALDVQSGGNRSNPLGGVLKPGEWRAAVQLVDYFGFLSPVSPLSSPALGPKQDNLTKERATDEDELADRLRFQIAWEDIPLGREGTIGRILGRTKDLRASGTAQVFQMSPNGPPGSLEFATLPDNVTVMYPDNTSDSRLQGPLTEVDAMPRFGVGAYAFGRLWIGAVDGDLGRIQGSHPGMFGSLDPSARLYPAFGGRIVALHASTAGLLVLTERSAHLVRPMESYDGFISDTISTTLGCVSPSTVVSVADRVLWLSSKGVVQLFEGRVEVISDTQSDVLERVNGAWAGRSCAVWSEEAREYRLAVPLDGATYNNHILVCRIAENGPVWTSLTYLRARAMAVTTDTRAYVLVLGDAKADRSHPDDAGNDFEGEWTPGLWVMDRESAGIREANDPEWVLETAWLSANGMIERKTPIYVHLLLMEHGEFTFSAETQRDYRSSPALASISAQPVASDNPQELLGDTALGSEVSDPMLPADSGTRDAMFRSARPYWHRFEVYVPNSEWFRLRFSGSGPFTVLALRFTYQDGADVGPRSG